jgi:site-specific DNA-methyltransferase (adenine-specific)/adenine-specific DNA-methyltransferase
MVKLTKEQIEKIKQILDENGELPPELRWELFPPEKHEYELVYGGKQSEEKIISETMAVPLQDVRTFNNGSGRPKKEQWYNRLIFGDNLQAMKSLLNDPDVCGKVKLIYIDPPFATKQDFHGSQDQKAYQDKIAGAQFVEFLRKRLVMIRELLAVDGVVYVHLDWRKCHYIKTALDEIFGESNFQNELIWQRLSARSDSRTFNHIHDVIYFYSKTQNFNFTNLYSKYSLEYLKKFYRYKDTDGRRFSIGDLTARGLRNGESGKPWRGIDPAKLGNHWKVKISTLDELDKAGEIYWPPKGKVPRLKQYLDEQKGRPLQSIWSDISPVQFSSSENVKYPTQKPEALLERIILSSSAENDLIMDAFAGAGTSLAVAEKLGRRWIGIDCGKLAMYTIQKRMLNLRSEIGNNGKSITAKPFGLQNAGLYDFATLKDLPWEDWRFFALQLFECHNKPHEIGNLKLDGLKGTAPVLVYDWKSKPDELISEETIADIHAMIGKKIGKKFYIIAPMMSFDFFQDYIDKDGVRYYALRIPYNMIKELHIRDFKSVLQAREANNVNDIQEAYGFSFMVAPEVEWDAFVRKPKGQLFKAAVLKTKKFKSHAWIKGEAQKGEKETLAMLMIDLDYDGKVFDLDKAFYGEELETNNWEALFSVEDIGEKIMAVWTDHHGNESKAIIPREQFGLSKAVNAKRGKNAKK